MKGVFQVHENGSKQTTVDGSPRKRKVARRGRTEWVNPKPNNSDVQWLDDNEDQFGAYVVAVCESIKEHERLSVKFDTASRRWIGVLFVDPIEDEGTVYALSCRASTAFLALVLVYYFHVHMGQGAWSKFYAEDGGRFG